MNRPKPVSKGLTATFLKWLALAAMITDHIGHTLQPVLPDAAYYAMRIVGRIAFPIFAFCVVEGFLHTRNFWKYLIRMFVFAIISEVPFDIMLKHSYLYWQQNNVLWTFVILLLVLYGIRTVKERMQYRFQIPLYIVITAAGAAVAYFTHTDYSWCGILIGVCFYLFRDQMWLMHLTVTACLFLSRGAFEYAAVLALLPIRFYDGRKALIDKELPRFFFYIIYPLHMLMLGLYGILLEAGV